MRDFTLHACPLQYVEFLQDQHINTEIQHQQAWMSWSCKNWKPLGPVPTGTKLLPF